MDYLQLDDSKLIGVGLHRKCYEHPENSNLCIKVGFNSNPKEDKREINYYKFLNRRAISWAMLPKFHGKEKTNLGEGVVFDLIRDEDGSVSKTLEYYLEEGTQEVAQENIINALDDLKEYLLQELILTMTLKPKNIIYQKYKNGSGKLIIIDNIGTSDFIPICKFSNTLAKQKILRKWKRFEQSLIQKYKLDKEFFN
ncbi:MAG: YrbL family protein [Lentisphaerales bacterium]|nr:YrbL family protein [Lentisphaerales bacterium]